MQRTLARVFGLALLFLAMAAAGGCRQDDHDAAARATVTRWVDAWTRASGPERDDAAARAARNDLSGGLLARTEAAAGDALAELRPRALARLYNDFVGVAIPPDRGFALLAVEHQDGTARVWVRLQYSGGAPGAAAAGGLIPFSQVAALSALNTRPPERVFTVTRADGEWRIIAIRPG